MDEHPESAPEPGVTGSWRIQWTNDEPPQVEVYFESWTADQLKWQTIMFTQQTALDFAQALVDHLSGSIDEQDDRG